MNYSETSTFQTIGTTEMLSDEFCACDPETLIMRVMIASMKFGAGRVTDAVLASYRTREALNILNGSLFALSTIAAR